MDTSTLRFLAFACANSGQYFGRFSGFFFFLDDMFRSFRGVTRAVLDPIASVPGLPGPDPAHVSEKLKQRLDPIHTSPGLAHAHPFRNDAARGTFAHTYIIPVPVPRSSKQKAAMS